MPAHWVLLMMVLYGGACAAEDYCAWRPVELTIPEALCGLSGDAGRGRVIVADKQAGNCLACHGLPIPEEPFHGTVGPPLDGVGSRLSGAELRLRLVDQQRLNPSTVMPPFYRAQEDLNQVADDFSGGTFLSPQDIEDIIAYLLTLKEAQP